MMTTGFRATGVMAATILMLSFGGTARAADEGAAQNQKGLVEYKGRWMKPEDAAWQRQQDSIIAETAPGQPHGSSQSPALPPPRQFSGRQPGPNVATPPGAPSAAEPGEETPSPDKVVLTNGNEMEGVIVRKTKTELRLQMGADSSIDLELSTVAEIKRGSPKAEAKKLEEWRREAAAAAQKERLGFHFYEGRWLNDVEYQTALHQSQDQDGNAVEPGPQSDSDRGGRAYIPDEMTTASAPVKPAKVARKARR
jgi:hypothetical protein